MSILRLFVLFSILPVASAMGGDSGGQPSAFGEASKSEASFIGVLYDLKQTQDHMPTHVTPNDYSDILDEFLSQGWNEAVLNRYYRVSRPLFTTQIFIPNMNADNAPKAFGAEKLVKPSRWVIHYKGQVSPPESGSYRFWGIADDVMALAVDGKTVLVGNLSDTRLPRTNWKPSAPDGGYYGDSHLKAGDWLNLKKDTIYDFDIIIGERPGGVFNAFLMVEKQGSTYPIYYKHPVLPIFQIAPYDTPKADDDRFSTGFPVWKCYQ